MLQWQPTLLRSHNLTAILPRKLVVGLDQVRDSRITIITVDLRLLRQQQFLLMGHLVGLALRAVLFVMEQILIKQVMLCKQAKRHQMKARRPLRLLLFTEITL